MAKKFYSQNFIKLFSWRPGTLAKNTILVTGGLSIRAIAQFFLFVGLARCLGVREYGGYVAVLAVMIFMVPIVGCGVPILLVREMANDRSKFALQFGKSLVIIGISVVPCFIVALIVADYLLPKEISRVVIFNVAVAELFFGPVIELSRRVFQAIEQLVYMVAIGLGVMLFRLIGFGFMLLVSGSIDAKNWSIYYLVSTGFAMFGALILVLKKIGRPKIGCKGLFAIMNEGIYYAITGASDLINCEIDKAFLARLTDLGIAGAYSAAYRFIYLILLPINALLESSSARFFREGKKGLLKSGAYAKKMLPITSFYAVISGVILFVSADFIPLLLGPEYIISVPIIKWLAILPFILMLRSFLSVVVLTGGCPRYNCMVYIVGALVNVGLNFCLIPQLKWIGAIIAMIIAESAMILLFYLAIRREIRLCN